MILSKKLDTMESIMKSQTNKEDSKMTSSIGLYFVIFILAMIPMVFLGAGKDTTHQRAERKQRQKEVLLDWTDKNILHGEELHGTPEKEIRPSVPAKAQIVRLPREAAGNPAA